MKVRRRWRIQICLSCLVVLTLRGKLRVALWGTLRADDLGSQIKKAMKEKSNVPNFQGPHVRGTFKRPLVTLTPAEARR